MCTLTWFAQPGGYQIFFNRDELRSRKPALAPACRQAGTTRFIAPRDADQGGTWICVSDRGIALCLLNGYALSDPAPPRPGFASRGEIPVSLIECSSLSDVGAALAERSLDRFRGFVLVGFSSGGRTAHWEWRDGSLIDRGELDPAVPMVSSSFDADGVRRRRGELFASMVAGRTDRSAELHLAYHESHVPERGPLSPCMHRPDGRTVSLSWIDVDAGSVCFRYAPNAPCAGRPRGRPLCLQRPR